VLGRRYELVSEIGRGGCAVVYEAVDLRLNRAVAVKLPVGVTTDSVRAGRFARESRVLARIQHPNVCAVLDSGIHDNVPFLVMERLFGESLRSTVARIGRLSVMEALAVGTQLLCALDAVHAAGIVHRDVKPDNVVLVARGGCDPLVKLLDFGLCRRATSRRPLEETMTTDGAIVGTPEYMAPEQVLGSPSLDLRVDVYAVGVVLYEALTGDRAFFSRDLKEILSGVMTKRVRPLRQLRPDAPPALEAIIQRAMHRDPDRRFPSAAEFQAELIAVRRGPARHPGMVSLESREEPATVADPWDVPTTRFRPRLPVARTAGRRPAPAIRGWPRVAPASDRG
jgi:serine/threonine-protein kinase